MKYGFLTVAAAIPSVRVADLHYNLEEIKRLIDEAERQEAAFFEAGKAAGE